MSRFNLQTSSLALFLACGISGLVVALGFGRFAYTPMVPVMMAQTQLGVDVAGYIASANYLGYIVGALTPLLLRAPHYRVNLLRAGLLLNFMGLLLLGINYASTWLFPVYGLARFLSGVGSGWILVNISSIVLERLAIARRMSLAGWLYSGVGLGSLIVTLMVMVFEYGSLLWYIDWLYLALGCAVLSVPVWLVLNEQSLQRAAQQRFATDGKQLLAADKRSQDSEQAHTSELNISSINIPAVWYLAFAYVCKGFSYIIVLTFLPVMTEGLNAWARSSWLVLLVVSIPSAVVWGILSERFGNIRSLQGAYLLHGVGMLLPVFWLNEFTLLACAVLVGATFMGIVTMISAQARRIKPLASTMILALITGVYGIGQMIGPSFAGAIAHYTGSFQYAMLTGSVCMFVAYVLLAKLRAAKQHMRANGELDETEL